jgi:hypothetical protein
MIDFTDVNEDLEKTQHLPALTPDVELDEALKRERAARIEIVELMRQNFQQAQEIERLRSNDSEELSPRAHRFPHAIARHITTEERLFEVCGALKDTLSKVLRECRTRDLALQCENSARRALEDSCETLEEILSAPGFCAPRARHADVAPKAPLARTFKIAEPAFRSMPASLGERLASANEIGTARVPRLHVVRSEAKV